MGLLSAPCCQRIARSWRCSQAEPSLRAVMSASASVSVVSSDRSTISRHDSGVISGGRAPAGDRCKKFQGSFFWGGVHLRGL